MEEIKQIKAILMQGAQKYDFGSGELIALARINEEVNKQIEKLNKIKKDEKLK